MSPETLQVVQSVDVVEGVPVESLSAEKYILYIDILYLRCKLNKV